jgi:hypothetical protein
MDIIIRHAEPEEMLETAKEEAGAEEVASKIARSG